MTELHDLVQPDAVTDNASVRLDDLMPHFDFRERHRRLVDASVAATWDALTTTTLNDLPLARRLLAVRHLGRKQPSRRPLLTDGPVQLIYRCDRQVAIAGAIGQPWGLRPARIRVSSLAEFRAFRTPGWTTYLTEFRVEPGPNGSGCVVSTETRGRSTSDHARRRFRLYWTVIRVPSGLIRREILRAVARLATETSKV